MAENHEQKQIIGLIVGREQDWPNAFMEMLKARDVGVTAEFVKLGGTYLDDPCPYPVIFDRMSHEIPYYRTYVKYAALNGSYIINNPFVWSADNRFFGTTVANRLGLKSPRTIVLPNKETVAETVPDSFRNLDYPMNWEGITEYIGVPAIFKEIRSGGRRLSFRVHNVDELIQRYDESGTRTMILQEVIQGGDHIHCLVAGQENALILQYSPEQNRYLPKFKLSQEMKEQVAKSATTLTKAYGYDFNLIEFNHQDGNLIVINSTNPSPIIDHQLFNEEQFNWIVNASVDLALERLANPVQQTVPFNLEAGD
jgi:glutathione synthase/RimK-type ligase-like ATP-grasp enzyme